MGGSRFRTDTQPSGPCHCFVPAMSAISVTGSWGYLDHRVLNNSKNNVVGRIMLFYP